MLDFKKILPEISASNDYDEKTQILALIAAYIKARKSPPSKQEKAMLSAFALSEICETIKAAKKAKGYKEKSLIFRYGDTFYFLIMALHKSPAEISPEILAATKELNALMGQELYLEQTMEKMFAQEIISVTDVTDLLARLSKTTDEYEKGLFCAGLIHHRNEHSRLLESSKLAIADYMVSEMERHIAEYGDDIEKTNSFEALCEACFYFINDRIIELLYKTLESSHEVQIQIF